MTIPQLLIDLLQLLFDLAMPGAICTMVLAGVALRQESGVNFEAGGRFQRWMFWSVILLTLPQFLAWFAAQGITMPPQSAGISGAWLLEHGDHFQEFRHGRGHRPAGSGTRCLLRIESRARCGARPKSLRVGDIRHVSADDLEQRHTDAGLEQWFNVRNDRHAGFIVELRGGNHSPRGGGFGCRRGRYQLCAPASGHATGRIGPGISQRIGNMEACPGDGRVTERRILCLKTGCSTSPTGQAM